MPHVKTSGAMLHAAWLQSYHAYLSAVLPKQLDEVVGSEKNGGGVVAGMYGHASGVDDSPIDDDFNAMLAIVERAERRDRSGDEAEHGGEVLIARKREAPRAQPPLDFAEGNALLIRQDNEVVRAVFVIAQEQVLGAELAVGDMRSNGFRHGEDGSVLVELVDNTFLIEQLQGFRFSVHGAYRMPS